MPAAGVGGVGGGEPPTSLPQAPLGWGRGGIDRLALAPFVEFAAWPAGGSSRQVIVTTDSRQVRRHLGKKTGTPEMAPWFESTLGLARAYKFLVWLGFVPGFFQ